MDTSQPVVDGQIFNEPPVYFATQPTIDFTGAIAVNAIANASFTNRLMHDKIRVIGVSIVSVQNLPWRVWFWGDAFFNAPAIAEDARLMGMVTFDPSAGYQIGGAGDFFYVLNPYQIPGLVSQPTGLAGFYYVNATPTSELNIGLQVAGGGVAKLAGAPGRVSVKVTYIYAGRVFS